MPDQFARQPVELDSPGRRFFVITPHDTNEIPLRPRALWIGGAGTVTVTTENGEVVTFVVPAGTWLPIVVTKVMDAMFATNIVGMR